MPAEYRRDSWPDDASCDSGAAMGNDDEVMGIDDESILPALERWFGHPIRQILNVAKPLIAILRR